jgi:hypothetical protein
MFDDTVLRTSLLDLLRELRETDIQLILGGGYGLYLRQEYLTAKGVRTLLEADTWPSPRATNDLDVFLRLEVIADPERVTFLCQALERLGYVAEVKYMQFVKPLGAMGKVKIDLLTGPEVHDVAGELVKIKEPRVRPKGTGGLHAYLTEDAIGIEEGLQEIPVEGHLSSGERFTGRVLLPQGFTYLVMKLCAFRDRKEDSRKDLARHHALDLYRIVAMLSEDEYKRAMDMSAKYRGHEVVGEARRIVADDFASLEGIGVLRLREHSQFSDRMDVAQFVGVLEEIFPRP